MNLLILNDIMNLDNYIDHIMLHKRFEKELGNLPDRFLKLIEFFD